MSLTYSNTTSPTLPGAPMTDAERNARAKVDDIAAAFELLTACGRSQFGLERDALSFDAITLLGDISWDADDGLDVLADAVDEYIRQQPLSIRAHGHSDELASLADGGGWIVDYHHIWLTFGGPSCWIICPDDTDADPEVWFSEAGTSPQQLRLSESQLDAVRSFCEVNVS